MNPGLPTISIVTPSYNQGQFLEETLLSVLSSGYPNLEYVVADGGSTDGSSDIIRKYADRLSYWISEPDKGQYDAINKGFEKTSGEIMAWLNSDDKYTPWALSVVADIFTQFPEVEWITSVYQLRWNEKGQAVDCYFSGGFDRKSFLQGANLPGRGVYGRAFIQQEATFWRRALWKRAGGYVETSLKLAGDFELWARFFRCSILVGVSVPLGGFRVHSRQKTATHLAEYYREAEQVLRAHGGHPYGRIEDLFRRGLKYFAGHRSLRKLPFPVGSALAKARILNPYTLCAWKENRWQLLRDYTV